MAHTSTTNPTSGAVKTDEVNYFFRDEHGQIAKMLKPVQVKQSQSMDHPKSSIVFPSSSARNVGGSGSSSGGVGNVGRMGAFSQMSTTNQGQFIRLQDGYITLPKTENTSYTTAVSAQKGNSTGGVGGGGGGGGAREVIKSGRYEKYTPNNAMKMKSKLHAIQSSPMDTMSGSSSSVQRKRKPDKAGKGLRHFSMKVCEKVQEKGKTTYNEVADDLVTEELKNNSYDSNCDQKNIRRRVYDALNVLMAINVISKDKKEIRWIGLPANSAEALEEENNSRRERIKQKQEMLRELVMQHVAFKGLVERNKRAESQGAVPSPNSSIQLPFIIVNTHKSTKINCSVTNDKSEYIFKFDNTFEMHDDIEVLKRMGLLRGLDKGECTAENIERVKAWVPPNLAKYVEAYGTGKVVDPMFDSDDDDNEFNPYLELTNESQSFAQHTQNTTDVEFKSEVDDDELEEDID